VTSKKLTVNEVGNLPFSKHANRNWVIISVLCLLLIGGNTYLSRITVMELTGLQANITGSGEVIKALQELQLSLLTAESGQRGFLLTENDVYLRNYASAIQRIEKYSAIAITLTSEVAGQEALIQKLVPLVKIKTDMLTRTVEQAKQGKFKIAIDVVETYEDRQVYSNIHNLFQLAKKNESNERNKQIAKLQKVTSQANTNGFVSFITGLLLVVGLYFMARLNIRNQENHHLDIENQNVYLQQAVQERTEELSIFSEELKRSNRELEDFAFVASHDLQEPLRKIMAFGDRLIRAGENLDDKQVDYLKRMRSAATRMSTLISDLLEFSRINSRGKPFQNVDLNVVIEHCLEDLSVLIDESDAQINCEKLPIVQADPLQMRQLLFNLVANAIKFSKDQVDTQIDISAVKTVSEMPVELADLSNWYSISVKDNGIGFEQEYADKIFAPFQRLHSRESFKGTGIGLAICRRIVERHNGTIVALGKAGEGATFSFSLPANNRIINALEMANTETKAIIS